MLQEQLSSFCERQTMSAPFKKIAASLCFEFLNVLADSWLGDIHLLRSSRKVQIPCSRNKHQYFEINMDHDQLYLKFLYIRLFNFKSILFIYFLCFIGNQVFHK